MRIKDWPVCWYPAITTKMLPIGAVEVVQLGGNDIVVARGESGIVFALDAHCPHMGAHLRQAKVIGDSLRCPLHHWHLSADGICDDDSIGPRSWPVQEQLGIVFIGFHNPSQTLPVLPGEGITDQYFWTTGAPIDLPVDWTCAIVNGFDLAHLRTVHHREIIDDPVIKVCPTQLQINYRTRVIGNSLADRFTRFLSGNLLHIEQRCLGTTVEIRSTLKKISTAAIISMLPTDKGIRVFGAYGVAPGPSAFLRGQLARQLFTAFLKKDVQILADMRMNLDAIDDTGVQAVADFLGALPQGPTAKHQPDAGSVISFVRNESDAPHRMSNGS